MTRPDRADRFMESGHQIPLDVMPTGSVRGRAKEASMATPKLGSGARFKALSAKLAAKGAHDPDALAAYIGRKKHGPKKMAQLAAKARKD